MPCACLFCAEGKAAAAVAGISDILSFKESLAPSADNGETENPSGALYIIPLCFKKRSVAFHGKSA